MKRFIKYIKSLFALPPCELCLEDVLIHVEPADEEDWDWDAWCQEWAKHF